MLSIPAAVARRLGFYVYMYIDPRSGRPFYVGKGKRGRVLQHFGARGKSRKARVLAQLRRRGLRPRLEILAHGLANEETALRIETAVIDLLALDQLTNLVRGWRSIEFGRMPLSQLVAYYSAKPVTIREPMLLIRINRRFRHGMPALELYEATRGIWKLGKRRAHALYAAAVFEAVIQEVFTIKSWHRAGSTAYRTRSKADVRAADRVEFEGVVAPAAIRSMYVGRSVQRYFPRGLRSPVVYVNA